eukprot:6473236-Amphidinium_carterae.2
MKQAKNAPESIASHAKRQSKEHMEIILSKSSSIHLCASPYQAIKICSKMQKIAVLEEYNKNVILRNH